MSQETSNFLLCTGSWNFLYSFYLCMIYLDAFVTDNETQKLTKPYPEGALVGFNLSLYTFYLSNNFWR